MSPDFCRQVIEQVTALQAELREQLGTTFAFLGDEIYLKAGRKVPSRAHYGDYPQIEDGIGMVRAFCNEFSSLLKRIARRAPHQLTRVSGTVMTGALFAPVLREQIAKLNERFGTELQVVAVANEYFGGDVSVAGLLTGSDFLKARHEIQGDFLIIPRTTLKSDEEIMLDGMSLDDLREQLGLPVLPFDLRAFENWISSVHNFTVPELNIHASALKA